jgi:hypothetical protein
MANQQQVDLLKQGSNLWNEWRRSHPDIKVNLRRAHLSKTNLGHADLREANLKGADLSGADLRRADLRKADLREINLRRARLWAAKLVEANLSGANLVGADLNDVNLRGANLKWTNLSGANLSRARLIGCSIYAISAWNVYLSETIQSNLIITDKGDPAITVDNLEIAQFIHLLLNNQKVRNVIDTITSKVVLIIGRFTPERKAVLDALREELRKHNYLPVLFDFEKPASRDLTETVNILARLARFIIVDLTDPSSAPHEVATIVPQCIVPVQPLLLKNDTKPNHEYAMFHDLRARYHWVLPTYQYQDTSSLIVSLKENVVDPAELKAKELAKL